MKTNFLSKDKKGLVEYFFYLLFFGLIIALGFVFLNYAFDNSGPQFSPSQFPSLPEISEAGLNDFYKSVECKNFVYVPAKGVSNKDYSKSYLNKLIDDDPKTYWKSNLKDSSHSLIFDLESEFCVGGVQVDFYSNYYLPNKGDVYVSKDGKAFKKVDEFFVNKGDNKTLFYDFNGTYYTRYVKLVFQRTDIKKKFTHKYLGYSYRKCSAKDCSRYGLSYSKCNSWKWKYGTLYSEVCSGKVLINSVVSIKDVRFKVGSSSGIQKECSSNVKVLGWHVGRCQESRCGSLKMESCEEYNFYEKYYGKYSWWGKIKKYFQKDMYFRAKEVCAVVPTGIGCGGDCNEGTKIKSWGKCQ
jgi:hypothetical protein